MTDEQIKIAVAEACGWKSLGMVTPGVMWQHPDERKDYVKTYWPPDYLTDLNAMHEAEKTLTPEQAVEYFVFQLKAVVDADVHATTEHYYSHAAARQRAIAFLRTLGKWKEETK